MFKRMLLASVLIMLCADLYGQRRGDKGREVLERTHNPDEDYDFKVDTVELRNWVSSVSTVYSYARDFLRSNDSVELARKFDKDNDRKLSTKESLEFRNYMKAIFEKASKKILAENDANKNRRLDKSELISLREKIPSFLEYALRNDAAEKAELVKKEEPAKKEVETTRALTDIYD